MKSVELLTPARDLETGRAAVDSGADAVYIGGPRFGARRAAGNTIEDVAALVEYARPFGVRVYAALNTLLFDDELAEAQKVARELVGAGVDALIVQDMAFLRMGPEEVSRAGISRLSGVEMHASTQTSNVNAEDIAFLGRAGFSRVILERSLTINEIREIRAATDVELEAFVHGAICVGQSGRCFLSRAMSAAGAAGGVAGARSGNRGDCSQPCRLTWDLVSGEAAGGSGGSGGEKRTIIKSKHLLSVRDLDLSAHLGELLDAGVTSLKIEGRLKDAGYVRNVVSYYNILLNRELEKREGMCRASVGRSIPDFVPDPTKSFMRGGTNYFFYGPKGAGEAGNESGRTGDGGRQWRIASFDTPKAVGESIGRVQKVGCERTGSHWFILESCGVKLAAGDGLCFFEDGELKGTNVNRVEGVDGVGGREDSSGSGYGLRVYPNDIKGIKEGMELYRNLDHTFARALERSRTKRRIGVAARLSGRQAGGLTLRLEDETGLVVEVSRAGDFEPARHPEKMLAVAREEIAKSGDTIFETTEVEVVGELPFVPVSVLAAMRREGMERLLEARRGLVVERHTAKEDPDVRYPRMSLRADENVTNRLAERFWRDHGVERFEKSLEMRQQLENEIVMRTRYCLRRELGECLKERRDAGSRSAKGLRGEWTGLSGGEAGRKTDLYLERGKERLRLDFDCENCQMTIVKI